MDSISADLTKAFTSPMLPAMSLRAGSAVDGYETPPPFDAALDAVTADYLEHYFWGLPHLDAVSWRYYLPILLGHALANLGNPKSMAVDALLASLRPPDRSPPRFALLSEAQTQMVCSVLEALAFQEDSAWKDPAILALEEYWAPGATYHDSPGA